MLFSPKAPPLSIGHYSNRFKPLSLNGVFIMVLLLLFWNALSGQKVIPYEYKQFTIVDGLPENTVYNSLQDSQNFMWFFTSSGVCRFDGRHFENYNFSKNLVDNEILGGFEDSNGRIWFKSFNGKLSFFNPITQQIESYKNNPSLIRTSQSSLITTIVEDPEHNIWISYNNSEYTKISAQGGITNSNIGGNLNIGFFLDEKGVVHSLGYTLKRYNAQTKNFRPVIETGARRYILAQSKGIVYYVLNDGIYKYEKGESSLFISAKQCENNEILSMTIDRDNILWIGIAKGVYKLNPNTGKIEYFYYTGSTVTSVTKDHEGNYWITTLGKGIYLLPTNFTDVGIINTSNYLSENEITALSFREKDSSLIIAVKPNLIYTRQKNGKLHATQIDTNNFLKINKILSYADDLWFITQNTNLNVFHHYFVKKPTKIRLKHVETPNDKRYVTQKQYVTTDQIIPFIVTTKNLYISKDSTLYILFYGLIKAKIKKPNFILYKSIILYPNQITRNYAITEDSQGRIWFGGIGGIGYYVPQKDSIVLLDKLTFESTINNISILNQNTLLVSTFAAGMYIIKDEKIISHWHETNGLSSNTVNNIFKQDDTHIWVGTSKGITLFTFQDTFYRNAELTYYGGRNNNPATLINDLLIIKDTIYLATNSGLYYFNINNMTPQYNKPILKILAPSFFNIKPNENYKLPYALFSNVNQINFNFQSIAFLNGEEVYYHYRLFANNVLVQEDSIAQKANLTLPFSSLSPGSYRLEIWCWRTDGSKSDTLSLPFKVTPPIVLSWGAFVFYIILGAWIFYKLLQFTNRKTRLRRELILRQEEENLRLEKITIETRQQKLALEKESLRARIDPHFVFNCLNNIMSFVYEKNYDGLKTNIPQLARLIRTSLQLGKQDFISIISEKNYLYDYLALEKMRFEDKFDFEIVIEDGVPQDQKIIPPLLLQIFVENALRHGFKNLPKDKIGTIKIAFQQNKGIIKCVVIDNGIGITNTQAHTSDYHDSMGLDIVRKRISLLNEMYKYKFNLNIYNNSEPETGTTIIFSIKL